MIRRASSEPSGVAVTRRVWTDELTTGWPTAAGSWLWVLTTLYSSWMVMVGSPDAERPSI